jgi:hypothetical protein
LGLCFYKGTEVPWSTTVQAAKAVDFILSCLHIGVRVGLDQLCVYLQKGWRDRDGSAVLTHL